MTDKDILSPSEYLSDKVAQDSFPKTITIGVLKNTVNFFKNAIKPNAEKDKPVILNLQNLLLLGDLAIKSMPIWSSAIVLNYSGVFPAYLTYGVTKNLVYGAKGGGYRASRDTVSSPYEMWKTSISNKAIISDSDRESEIKSTISKTEKKHDIKLKQLLSKMSKER